MRAMGVLNGRCGNGKGWVSVGFMCKVQFWESDFC